MTWATFSEEHHHAIAEIVMSGSDTVVAIVGGAYLEDTLSRTLSERFKDDKDILNKIFKQSGALGSAGSKVDVLYLLHAFDRNISKAMYGICDIRNVFAHNLGTTFDSKNKKMIDAFKNFSLHEDVTYYPHHIYDGDTDLKVEKIKTNRDIFVVNLQLCLIYLMRDRVGHYSHTNTRKTESDLDELRSKWESMDRKGLKNIIIVPATSPRTPPVPKTPPEQKKAPSRKERKRQPQS